MKQVVRWWQTVTFWNKTKATIASLGAGGEITLLLNESAAGWHIVTVFATVLGILLTNFIEDKDNDGVVDLFEEPKEDKPNE